MRVMQAGTKSKSGGPLNVPLIVPPRLAPTMEIVSGPGLSWHQLVQLRPSEAASPGGIVTAGRVEVADVNRIASGWRLAVRNRIECGAINVQGAAPRFLISTSPWATPVAPPP